MSDADHETLARERVLQLLSVEIEIESDDSDPPFRAALNEAFDALCERWGLRLASPPSTEDVYRCGRCGEIIIDENRVPRSCECGRRAGSQA